MVWEGWAWPPSPALMMGTRAYIEAGRGAFFGVAHGDDVGIVADDAGRVGHRLALAGARKLGPCKAQRLATEAEHGRLEGEAGAGAGFIEQRRKDAPVAQVRIGSGIRFHPVGKGREGPTARPEKSCSAR